jgi:hypothetical protein
MLQMVFGEVKYSFGGILVFGLINIKRGEILEDGLLKMVDHSLFQSIGIFSNFPAN